MTGKENKNSEFLLSKKLLNHADSIRISVADDGINYFATFVLSGELPTDLIKAPNDEGCVTHGIFSGVINIENSSYGRS